MHPDESEAVILESVGIRPLLRPKHPAGCLDGVLTPAGRATVGVLGRRFVGLPVCKFQRHSVATVDALDLHRHQVRRLRPRSLGRVFSGKLAVRIRPFVCGHVLILPAA
jgi:hypothetical protein